jgi:DNA repair exonuclease SbcCD nuclease subunit
VFFRSRVPSKIIDLAYDALHKFAQHGIPVFIVPGNHERSLLPTSLLLTDRNIHVFDRPRTFEVHASGGSVALSGFACIRTDVESRFNDALAKTGWRETDAEVRLLCIHQTVEGARVGPAGYTFRAARDVVSVSAIPGDFTATLSGHIHRRQILSANSQSGAGPIIYPGSIERTSFAEKDELKGFCEISFAPSPTGAWGIKMLRFKDLPARPMVDIEIDPDVGTEGLIDYLLSQIAGIHKDSIIRLGSKGQLSEEIRGRLTAKFLRSVFPLSMNVELRNNLFNPSYEEITDGRQWRGG